jgi:hypothetical protein
MVPGVSGRVDTGHTGASVTVLPRETGDTAPLDTGETAVPVDTAAPPADTIDTGPFDTDTHVDTEDPYGTDTDEVRVPPGDSDAAGSAAPRGAGGCGCDHSGVRGGWLLALFSGTFFPAPTFE